MINISLSSKLCISRLFIWITIWVDDVRTRLSGYQVTRLRYTSLGQTWWHNMSVFCKRLPEETKQQKTEDWPRQWPQKIGTLTSTMTTENRSTDIDCDRTNRNTDLDRNHRTRNNDFDSNHRTRNTDFDSNHSEWTMRGLNGRGGTILSLKLKRFR